mmetsp:Transcript_123227/g.354077  ORF Transcript_123227/g.354077 Transcript_123227/m.354077 type:complete len:201 (-) Transcript_123227:528-1130(-)
MRGNACGLPPSRAAPAPTVESGPLNRLSWCLCRCTCMWRCMGNAARCGGSLTSDGIGMCKGSRPPDDRERPMTSLFSTSCECQRLRRSSTTRREPNLGSSSYACGARLGMSWSVVRPGAGGCCFGDERRALAVTAFIRSFSFFWRCCSLAARFFWRRMSSSIFRCLCSAKSLRMSCLSNSVNWSADVIFARWKVPLCQVP